MLDLLPDSGSNIVKEAFEMQLITVKIDKPQETNFIFGQTHFIKSVEDLSLIHI